MTKWNGVHLPSDRGHAGIKFWCPNARSPPAVIVVVIVIYELAAFLVNAPFADQRS